MKIIIGLTKTFRMGWKGSTIDYVPSMDGYHDEAVQDILVIEVESPDLDTQVVGEAYYCATNAPEEVVNRDPIAKALLAELRRKQAAGELTHRVSMDVGDTIQIGDDGPKYVVAPMGFELHTPGQVTCGRGPFPGGTSS